MSPGEIVIQLGDGIGDRFGNIVAGWGDVAQSDQMFHRFRGSNRIDLCMRWVCPGIPGNGVPRFDGLDFTDRFEGRRKNLAIHVLAAGKSKQMQDRRGDVEQIGPVNRLSRADSRPMKRNHPELAVLDRRSRRFRWNIFWPQRVGVKTMVTQQDDGRLGTRELK